MNNKNSGEGKSISKTWVHPDFRTAFKNGAYNLFEIGLRDAYCFQSNSSIGAKSYVYSKLINEALSQDKITDFKKLVNNFVIDSFAEGINEALCAGRNVPSLSVLSPNLIMPSDNDKIVKSVFSEMVDLCLDHDCVIPSSSFSVNNGFNNIDLSMGLVSFFDKKKSGESRIRPGDIVVGVRSSGIHNSGFNYVNSVTGRLWGGRNDFMKNLATPSFIYWKVFQELISNNCEIDFAFYVNKGGFSRLKKFVPQNLDVNINDEHGLGPQEIFKKIFEFGRVKKELTDRRMYEWFNNGIGLLLFVKDKNVWAVEQAVKSSTDLNAEVIGEIIPGEGIVSIKSYYSGEKIIF